MDLVVTNKALTYYTDPIKLRSRPRKKKKNRKKQVLPKNKINIGFDEGFAEVYFKKIFHKTI